MPAPPITKATFEKAITRPEQAPPPRPSVVFAGRSNVGKSSLINKLVNQRSLARTSNTPGRTQEIIFFNIEDRAWFIDLPGYGYAKVPLAIKRRWRPMIENFLGDAKELRLVLVLLDIRRDPGEDEFLLRDWLERCGIPYIYGITKIDKLSRAEQHQRLAQLQQALELETDDSLIPLSTVKHQGIEELLQVIQDVLKAPSDSADEPEIT